jgi:hypothetical protein
VISFIELFGVDEQGKEKDVGTLLLEFFEYYGKKFVYPTTGITIQPGRYESSILLFPLFVPHFLSTLFLLSFLSVNTFLWRAWVTPSVQLL